MAQVVPTMVAEVISGLTICKLRALIIHLLIASPAVIRKATYPWMAPSTDWDGVRTPSVTLSVPSDQRTSIQRTGHDQRYPQDTNDLQQGFQERAPFHPIPRGLAARLQFIRLDPLHLDRPLFSRIASHDVRLWYHDHISVVPTPHYTSHG